MTTTIVQNSFLPTSIPGCQIWLDGADPAGTGIAPINGSSISTWADKSGNAKSATATAGNATFSAAALNGRGVLAFGGAAYLTSPLSMATTTPLTYFAVARPNVTGGFYAVSAINGGPTIVRPNTLMLYKAFNDYWWFSGGTAAVDGNTVTLLSSTSRYDINANYWSPSYTQMNINGTSYASSTAAPSSLANGGTLLIAAASGSPPYEIWNGLIAELIIYNSALTTLQRQQVEGYLAWKWGLVANLPSNHPYKNTPAVIITQPSTLAFLTVTNRLNNALFLPTSIPGCQLWFDAADRTSMTFSGSTVTQWNDKSGNGRNATNGGYVAPTYSATGFNGGYPALLFNGSSAMLNTAALLPTPVLSANGTDTTIFVVFNYTALPPTGGYVLYGLGSQGNTYVTRTPWNAGGAAGGAIIDTASLGSRIVAQFASVNPAQLYSILRSGASHFFYQFGSLSASNLSSSGTVGTTSQTFGIGGGIADGFFNSFISEVVIYNVALTTIQRQQIEGYLAWKWGLQANLPSTHPYKAAPFSPFSAVASVASLLNTNQINSKLISNYFNPRSIAVTRLWLDAADRNTVVLSGTSVTQWNDKSGNVSNATGTGGLSYIPGQGITFNGTNGYFSVPGAANSIIGTPFTVFIVEKVAVLPSAGLPMGIFANDPNTGVLYGSFFTSYQASGAMTFGWYGADQTTSSTVTAGTTRLWNFNYTGSQRRILLNGTAVATESWTQNLVTGAFTQPVIGRLWGTYYYNGTISELILYVGNINNQQCQQVEGYLAWKWGLQANLPATHAYKLFPPSPN